MGLSGIREHLKPFYNEMGRPSIDPELMIRMLIMGYCTGFRSERRLCDGVHLNLAYRWFCRLGLEGDVPDHSTSFRSRCLRRDVCDRAQLVLRARGLPNVQADRIIEIGLNGASFRPRQVPLLRYCLEQLRMRRGAQADRS